MLMQSCLVTDHEKNNDSNQLQIKRETFWVDQSGVGRYKYSYKDYYYESNGSLCLTDVYMILDSNTHYRMYYRNGKEYKYMGKSQFQNWSWIRNDSVIVQTIITGIENDSAAYKYYYGGNGNLPDSIRHYYPYSSGIALGIQKIFTYNDSVVTITHSYVDKSDALMDFSRLFKNKEGLFDSMYSYGDSRTNKPKTYTYEYAPLSTLINENKCQISN